MYYSPFTHAELEESKQTRLFHSLLKEYWFQFSRRQHILSNKFFKRTETPEIDITLEIISWKLHEIDSDKAALEIANITKS